MAKRLFNDDWQFMKLPLGSDLADFERAKASLRDIDVPHDYLIWDTKDLYENGEGWYRKAFSAADVANKSFRLYFEGVYMDSTYWLNGKQIGEWKYGYTSFELDLTPYIVEGANELIARIVYRHPNSRWYSGAGIFRDVWLKETPKSFLVSDGVYVRASRLDGNDAKWQVRASAEIRSDRPVSVRLTIRDPAGAAVASGEAAYSGGAGVGLVERAFALERPRLWSPDDPALYSLTVELAAAGGATLDSETARFGFRWLRFEVNEGFFINGRYLKLHGACEHHDLGSLGSAVNRVALRRQFETLKEMGVNAIRTSHNPPAVAFMELADEMGLLIVSEAYDIWELHKTDYDYASFFKEWWERDTTSWVRRDRNHPSIIMWSIGNEIYDTHVGPRGEEVTRMLADKVRALDPDYDRVVTIGSNYMAWDGAQRCADIIKIGGYNYAEYLYDDHHRKYPDWIIYGSETSSTIQSRGVYHFPASHTFLSNDDEQCSSLGNCSTGWGAKSTQRAIIDDRDHKFCLGQFIWTGFDYIGEPTPYFTKNSYFGQIDTAGFKKDTFFLYQAEWTDYRVKPMVHVLPYWDFNDGQLIDIRVYTNAPRSELFFNGESLGAFEHDHAKGQELSGKWQIPYRPGTLRAVAYDETGKVIAVDERSSFGDAVALVATADKTALRADGVDLAFVEISALDAAGHPVENANNRVTVRVEGAGRLVGLDNGDSTDYDQYKGSSRRLFNGKLLAIVASRTAAGPCSVTVSGVGLATATVSLTALTAPVTPGISARTANYESTPNPEIPVRRVCLAATGKTALTAEQRSVRVVAALLPANATWRDLSWKVVTVGGIDTNTAKVEPESDGMAAVVTALGDGEFRLRCSVANGRGKPSLMSELEFSAIGLGQATFNPYELVAAGLNSRTSVPVKCGNCNVAPKMRKNCTKIENTTAPTLHQVCESSPAEIG